MRLHPILRAVASGARDGLADTLRNLPLLVGLGICLWYAAPPLGLDSIEALAGVAAIYFAVRIAIRDED